MKKMKHNTQKQYKDIVTFHKMGNLMFYPDGTSVNPSNRFFYFKTLLTDYQKNIAAPEYTVQANQIGRHAVEALSENPFGNFNDEDSRAIEIIESAMKILETGIAYERDNEKQYIKAKLAEFKRLTPTASSKTEELKTIEYYLRVLEDDDTGIDYNALINAINVALQGKANTLAIYASEQEHLTDLRKRMNEAEEHFLRQVDGLSKRDKISDTEYAAIRRQRSQKRFKRAAVKTYLLNHTYNINKNKMSNAQKSLRKAMEGVKTIDVKMSEKLTAYLNQLFSSTNDDLRQQLLDVIVKNGLVKEGYSASEKEIKGIMISIITKYFDTHLSEILDKEIDYNKISDDMVKELANVGSQEYNIQVEGLYNNFGQYGKQVDFFKKSTEEILNGQTSSKGLYDALVKFKKSLGKKLVRDMTEEEKLARKTLGLGGKNNKYDSLLQLVSTLENLSKKMKRSKNLLQEFNNINIGTDTENNPINLTIKEEDGKIVILGLDQLKNTAAMQGLNPNFKSFNPTSIQGAISTIKSRISTEIRNDLVNVIKNARKKQVEDVIKNRLKSQLSDLKISIGGPTYSEIREALQESMNNSAKFWSGKLNIKNDNISILIADPGLFNIKINECLTNMNNEVNDKINSLMQNIATNYNKQYMDLISDRMKKVRNDRAYTDYKRLSEDFFSAAQEQRELHIKILKEFEESKNELLKQMQADGIAEKEAERILNERENFLNDLQNTLYISSTSKTFNNYNEEIGFIGGSIGSNIINQINNLNTLFEQAGIGLTQEEIDWLIFAAINNSSLSVIGRKNEDILESILGSLAIFAIFDEGGAELAILRDKIMETVEDNSNPNIMHLYLLNGIYYPGSYVLTTVLNNLKQILNELKVEVRHAGTSNIKITNTTTFDVLPNRGYKNQGSETLNRAPWETVRDSAIARTEIHITFLAGLMDVINNLHHQLKEISLPNT